MGVAPEVVHRELHDLVFKEKGKYSTQQITATTSWLAGQILSGKRVNDIVWDEGPDDTNEDGDFDNPEKNASRDWQIEQFLKHTTLDIRQNMHMLLLPGQNDFDLEAFTNIGIQGKNLLTYILGKHPKAVARYLRNTRRYQVGQRRVGKMNESFPAEPTLLRGAYIDYFSQFCQETALDAHLLPLDPNYYPICIGYNFKKGREHAATKEYGNIERARTNYLNENLYRARDGSDITRIHIEGLENAPESLLEMKDLRDEIVYTNMFSYAGVANQKNWIAPDLVKAFTKLDPENADLNDMDVIVQYLKVRQQLKNLVMAASLLDEHTRSLGIHTWMTDVAASAATAVINTPVVRYLEEPFSYVSGQSSKPFQSYFGVLETKKARNEQHMRAIEFVFALGTTLLKKMIPLGSGHHKQLRINIHDLIRVQGKGSKKKITILEGSKHLAEVGHDALLEARMELGISSCSVDLPGERFEDRLQKEVAVHEMKKERANGEERAQEAMSGIMQKLLIAAGQLKMRRNAPCICGSNKKFKHCCMRDIR